MKRKFAIAAATALAGMLAFSFGALAARPPGAGGGGGGGGGHGGGGGGGGKPPTTTVFADMVLIDRDVNGVPILTLGVGPGDSPAQVPQPIMLGPKATMTQCPLWYIGSEPQVGEGLLSAVTYPSVYSALDMDAYHIPLVDGEIPAAYAGCVTEADLGRLSWVRSPADVRDRALVEVVTTLSNVNGETSSDGSFEESITLDAAGRLVANYLMYDVVVDGEVVPEVPVEKTIDAPAENGAAFERILEQARLYHADVNDGAAIKLPETSEPPTAQQLLDRTAAMLGAASDKFAHVGLDEVIYATQILAIGTDMNTEARETFGTPWAGGYFNFSAFEYDRGVTYIGNVCYLQVTNVAGFVVTAEVVKEPIMDVVFGGEGFRGTNAYAFAQAVDDSRAVIFFVHENPVPAELLYLCDEVTPAEMVPLAPHSGGLQKEPANASLR